MSSSPGFFPGSCGAGGPSGGSFVCSVFQGMSVKEMATAMAKSQAKELFDYSVCKPLHRGFLRELQLDAEDAWLTNSARLRRAKPAAVHGCSTATFTNATTAKHMQSEESFYREAELDLGRLEFEGNKVDLSTVIVETLRLIGVCRMMNDDGVMASFDCQLLEVNSCKFPNGRIGLVSHYSDKVRLGLTDSVETRRRAIVKTGLSLSATEISDLAHAQFLFGKCGRAVAHVLCALSKAEAASVRAFLDGKLVIGACSIVCSTRFIVQFDKFNDETHFEFNGQYVSSLGMVGDRCWHYLLAVATVCGSITLLDPTAIQYAPRQRCDDDGILTLQASFALTREQVESILRKTTTFEAEYGRCVATVTIQRTWRGVAVRRDERRKSLLAKSGRKPSGAFKPLKIGSAVVAHGLKAAPELNGRKGIVTGWNGASERYEVRFEGESRRKMVRPRNLVI